MIYVCRRSVRLKVNSEYTFFKRILTNVSTKHPKARALYKEYILIIKRIFSMQHTGLELQIVAFLILS